MPLIPGGPKGRFTVAGYPSKTYKGTPGPVQGKDAAFSVPTVVQVPPAGQESLAAAASVDSKLDIILHATHIAVDVPPNMDATLSLDNGTVFKVTDSQGFQGGIPLPPEGKPIRTIRVQATNNGSSAQQVRFIVTGRPS